MIYQHKKTGNRYRHLGIGCDCTDARDGTLVVIYCPLNDEHIIYVRDQAEHEARFDIVPDPEPAQPPVEEEKTEWIEIACNLGTEYCKRLVDGTRLRVWAGDLSGGLQIILEPEIGQRHHFSLPTRDIAIAKARAEELGSAYAGTEAPQ